MSTWEQRMAEKAAARATVREAEALTAAQAEYEARLRNASPAMMRTFRGSCDVCGGPLEATMIMGEFDYGIDDDGLYTWIRHLRGPLQPDCGRYSSRVYADPDGQE